MFTNWAAVFTIPRLFTTQQTEEILRVRRRVFWTMIIYSVGAPLLVLVSPISKGGTVGILLSVYSILLSFQFVPLLVESERSRRMFNRFNMLLVLLAMINVLAW